MTFLMVPTHVSHSLLLKADKADLFLQKIYIISNRVCANCAEMSKT